jgi:hypothetical protein
MAKTLESSDYTSIRRRIEQALTIQLPNRIDQQPASLMPFACNPREPMPKGLPLRLSDYLEPGPVNTTHGIRQCERLFSSG